MVAVFVALRKLQVAVEKKPVARLAVRHHDALVGRVRRECDPVLVELVLGQRGDLFRRGKGDAQGDQRQRAGQRVRTEAAQLVPEQPQRPQCDGGVHQAKKQAGADQAQLGNEHQRESDRHRQRAQVVEGEHLRHQILEGDVAPQDAHHQRDLQPHQDAHQCHQSVEQKMKRARQIAIGQEQQRRHGATGERHQQFDAQEMGRQLPLEEARAVGAQAHGEQIAADDGGELQHRVAQQVGGDGTSGEFVDETAGGHHEHAGEQRDLERARGDGAGFQVGVNRAPPPR